MDRFRRMEIFIAVIEAGQVTRAAETLNLSKSAVSHALTDLEKYLDLQLIIRNNRSWQVTDAGSDYYEQCKKIIATVDKMEDKARRDNQRLSGLIRISAPDTFGSYILSPVIAKFMDMHPDIIIDMNLTERFVDLIEERVDLAFRIGQIKDNNLVAHNIGETKMVICASPDYLDKYGTPKSHHDLKNHKCLLYSRNPKWRLYKKNRLYKFTPKSPLITNNGETVREFCIGGQGIAFIPMILADFPISKNRLVETLTDYKGETLPINVIQVRGNRASRRVTQLLDFIIDEFRTRPQSIATWYKA